MLTTILTGSIAELIGGLALLLLGVFATWFRHRRRAVRTSADAQAVAGRQARTYTLLGIRAPDGHPVHLVSARTAGTVVTQRGPTGRQRYELTDAILADGTYAAEPLNRYQ
ncbi:MULTISPECIES: hypothetical protein [unclassified Streptomyces]|uniref:hypothetical protein n=1 Tax=unclassified Streptomyces TaxID=2593676 RepID=UPI002E2AE06C|nr:MULTISPECIES: hypothetical protein [unclassified Streptomyces]